MDLEKFKTELERRYPLGVPRKRLTEITGGVLNHRTLANMDSLGTGIVGRFTVGREVVYPVDGIVNFIKQRMGGARD